MYTIFNLTWNKEGRKEGNILFNNTLNTFYLRLYGVRHMIKDHSGSDRGNTLPLHRLLFPISSKGSFICIIPPGTKTRDEFCLRYPGQFTVWGSIALSNRVTG